MKKRSGFRVMMNLVVLVKPLTGYMVLAIIMGLMGHLAASFITIFGGYALAELLAFDTSFSITFIFVSVCVFALMRGILRYAEQACNHYIAFKLLALIRNKLMQKDLLSKREQEKELVSQMIALYCKKKHLGRKGLCKECEELMAYARMR